MNRRQFTASLGALSSAAALPLPAFSTTAATPAVSSAAYSWAKLIVRAQAKADPAMLARHLNLTPDVAQNLFHALIRDGILRAPAATGVAQAVHPVHASAQSTNTGSTLTRKMRNVWERANDGPDPLANHDTSALGCDDPDEKDAPDARPCEPLQESPRQG